MDRLRRLISSQDAEYKAAQAKGYVDGAFIVLLSSSCSCLTLHRHHGPGAAARLQLGELMIDNSHRLLAIKTMFWAR